MQYFHRQFLPFDQSFLVHQATDVGTGNHFSIMFYIIIHPGESHGRGHRFLCNTKSAAKTTTLIRSVQWHQFNALYHLQQLQGL